MVVLEAEFSEGKDGRFEDLLSLSSGTYAIFHRSKRVTRPAQVQGSGETDNSPLAEKRGKITLQRSMQNGMEEFVAIKNFTTFWENSSTYQAYSFSNSMNMSTINF